MKKKWALLIIAITVMIIYFICDPVKCHFPRCPFLQLTGLKCPGCGSQRTLHSLLHFDFIQSIRYNAFLVISIPVILILIYSEIVRMRSNIYIKIQNKYFIWTYFTLVVGWWIIRNIFDW